MILIPHLSNAQWCDICEFNAYWYDAYLMTESDIEIFDYTNKFPGFSPGDTLPIDPSFEVNMRDYGYETMEEFGIDRWEYYHYDGYAVTIYDNSDYDHIRQMMHDTLMNRIGTSVSRSKITGRAICGNIISYFSTYGYLVHSDLMNLIDTYTYRQTFEENPYFVYFGEKYLVTEDAKEQILRDKVGFFLMSYDVFNNPKSPINHVDYIADIDEDGYLHLASQNFNWNYSKGEYDDEDGHIFRIYRKIHIDKIVNNEKYAYFWGFKQVYNLRFNSNATAYKNKK